MPWRCVWRAFGDGEWREGGEANWAQLYPENRRCLVHLSLVSHIPTGRWWDRGESCWEEAPLGQGPAASQRDLGSDCRKNEALQQGQDCSCPKSEDTFRSPLVPTIPWLLHQLWFFMGAAPVTPVTHESLGGVLGKRGELPGQNCGQLAEFSTPALSRC